MMNTTLGRHINALSVIAGAINAGEDPIDVRSAYGEFASHEDVFALLCEVTRFYASTVEDALGGSPESALRSALLGLEENLLDPDTKVA